MNLRCSKEKLKNAVAQAEKITGKNTTLPILSTILLIAKNKTLTIRATNLDVGIEIEIPVKIENEGEAAVPGNILSNTLSSIVNQEEVILEEKNGNIEIRSGENSTYIKCFSTEEFPTLPMVSEGECFSINNKDFIDGILSVVYSASTSDIKPELSSIYIYPEGNTLVFVSTDSFRLAEKRINIKNHNEFNGIIIPFKNAVEISRVLESQTTQSEIRFNKNQVAVSFDSLYLTSRIIDGVFPDYKQIIPKEHKTEVVVLKQDLINTLKINNIFSNKFNQTLIKALPSKKIFQLQTKNSNIGETLNTIDAALTGEDMEININHKYLTDCFQSLHKDSVSLTFSGQNKPIIIKSVGDTSFKYLIMPMNK